MGKSCVGIDVGVRDLHLAVCSDGQMRRAASREMPEDMIKNGQIVSVEAAAEFIKETMRKAKIGVRNAAVALPSTVTYTQLLTLPVMTTESLTLNLPYEFRDFISQEMDKYFYDYAVLSSTEDESGKMTEFTIIASTVLKETIEDYQILCRRSGLKLRTAVPEEVAYMNIIRAYEKRIKTQGVVREYCFLDIGHSEIRLLFYKGAIHRATRVIDYGLQAIDIIIADKFDVNLRMARSYKHANTENVLESDLCMSLYSNIGLELNRALNFYRFNSPDSELQDVYLCGGGLRVDALVRSLREDLPINVHSLSELLPGVSKDMVDASVCQMAIGAALQ